MEENQHPAALLSTTWIFIYKIGGFAALTAALVFRRNLSAEYSLLKAFGLFPAGPLSAPASALEWFELLQEKPLLGLTLLNSALVADIPVAMGTLTIVGIMTLLSHLVADIGYAFLDPRIRFN